MGNVGYGISELCRAEWAPGPSGEAVVFVERIAGDALHKLVVRHRVPVAEHHGGDLGIDDGMRDDAGLVPADLDILPRRMKYLENVLARHQGEKRGEIEVRGKRVDDHRL